jgi:hypothetical protein
MHICAPTTWGESKKTNAAYEYLPIKYIPNCRNA